MWFSVLLSFKVKDNDIPGTLTFVSFCFSLYFFARAIDCIRTTAEEHKIIVKITRILTKMKNLWK